MNSGAFGENFPYTNFHDMNTDWVIKIAKDFLDQYTHIQDVISNGETSLSNLTTEGIEQIETKANALEALLQAWYNTHSEDIASQLASALDDLNEALQNKITDFNTSADAKGAEVIASIPSDYSTLSNEVSYTSKNVVSVGGLSEPIYGEGRTATITATRYEYNNININFEAGKLYRVTIKRSQVATEPIPISTANNDVYVDQNIAFLMTGTDKITVSFIPSANASNLRIKYAETTAGIQYTGIVEKASILTYNEQSNRLSNVASDEIFNEENFETVTSTAWLFTQIPHDFYVGNIYKVTIKLNIPSPDDILISTSNDLIYVEQDIALIKKGTSETTFIFIPTQTASHLRLKYAGSEIITYTVSFKKDMYQKPVSLEGTHVNYWRQYDHEPVSDNYATSMRYDVSKYTKVRLCTYKSAYINWATFLDENDNCISYLFENSDLNYFTTVDLIVPENAVTLESGNVGWKAPLNMCYGLEYAPNCELPYLGKDMIWLGTSIPSDGLKGTTSPKGYPYRVAQKLGATCVNNAIGGSAVHYRFQNRVNQNTNPYGFGDNFDVASRCLTNNLTMMNWIIENYNSGVFTRNVPETMTAELRDRIRSYSYENLITPYLNTPHIFVLDHGHNESFTYENQYSDSDPYNTFTFRGAMNFIINMILSANPKHRVIIIGEYENQANPVVSEYQEVIAKDWSLPIMPLWDYLGYSQRVINTKGGWVDGYWNDNAYPNGHDMKLIDTFLCDGIHPGSDLSGKTLEYEAYHIANWLKNYNSI